LARQASKPSAGLFFITDSGYIITNDHVVEGTQQVNIVLSDGTQQKATIVGTDLYSEQVQVTLGEAPQG
jgi:S1-C subfamily serine protease